MTKKMVSLRLSQRAATYLAEKSKTEKRTQVSIIEEFLKIDEQNKSGYMENLAKAVTAELNKNLKPIRLAINDTNRIVKIHGELINYQMLAHQLKMPYYEYGEYRHFAREEAEKIIQALELS